MDSTPGDYEYPLYRDTREELQAHGLYQDTHSELERSYTSGLAGA
jgi:hypothetical protein